MADSKDKNNSPSDKELEKMIEDIVSEVFKDWEEPEEEEEEDDGSEEE